MKDLKLDKFSIPICILLFNLLFWSEKMGLNALLFTLVIVTMLAGKYKGKYHFSLLATIAGTLIAAVMVLINNSALSKVILMLSSLAMAGFFHREDLKFLGFSFLASLRQVLNVPRRALSSVFSNKQLGKTVPSIFSNYMKFGIIPTFVFGFFFVLYTSANQKFTALISDYIELLFSSSSSTFTFFSFDQFMFFLLSVLVTGTLLFKPITERFKEWQSNASNDLERKRNKHFGLARFSMLALRKEYKVGLIMMIALNALLFVVNLTDIVYVWFSFEPMTATELSNFVHDGTYILIMSIMCAMGVLLYYFHGNINFLAGIKPLKYAAFVWIVQNIVLAASVCIRNYHYIKEYGLASKRIGVLVFLALTVFGLLLMWVKIRDRKTAYFLLDRNAWALYGMLIFLTFFNWDVLITRYNLSINSNKPLDAYYLINTLSNKNLPLLLEHEEDLERRSINGKNWVGNALKYKQNRFNKRQATYSLLSWNYRDWKVKKAITGN